MHRQQALLEGPVLLPYEGVSEKDHEIYNWWCATSPSATMRNSPIAAIQTEHGRITYNGQAIKVFERTQTGQKVSELSWLR